MEIKDILEAGELLNSKNLPKSKRVVYLWSESSTEINFVTVENVPADLPFARVTASPWSDSDWKNGQRRLKKKTDT